MGALHRKPPADRQLPAAMQQRQGGNRHSHRLVKQHSPGRTWNPLRALYWWYFVGSPAAVQQKLGAAQHKLADLQLHRLRNTGEVALGGQLWCLLRAGYRLAHLPGVAAWGPLLPAAVTQHMWQDWTA